MSFQCPDGKLFRYSSSHSRAPHLLLELVHEVRPVVTFMTGHWFDYARKFTLEKAEPGLKWEALTQQEAKEAQKRNKQVDA